jgi:hypothetical protein
MAVRSAWSTKEVPNECFPPALAGSRSGSSQSPTPLNGRRARMLLLRGRYAVALDDLIDAVAQG